jgi:DNA-binding CsgD family transcriptional regulator
MKLYDFTKPELDLLLALCNFTPDEEEYFKLRSKAKSNVQIAMEMHISEAKVSVLARKVKNKIKRIL